MKFLRGLVGGVAQSVGVVRHTLCGRVTSKLYDFINNDDRNTVVTHKLWLGE